VEARPKVKHRGATILHLPAAQGPSKTDEAARHARGF